MEYFTYVDSPAGLLTLTARDDKLTGLFFTHTARPGQTESATYPVLQEAERQLRQYFTGARKSFDIPVLLSGTGFQLDVWEALRSIPYAETRSYADIAKTIKRPKAFRAVGQANHRNPISIIIPCHRVVGSGGSLGGYGGGVSVKEFLLDLEQRFSGSDSRLDRI